MKKRIKNCLRGYSYMIMATNVQYMGLRIYFNKFIKRRRKNS